MQGSVMKRKRALMPGEQQNFHNTRTCQDTQVMHATDTDYVCLSQDETGNVRANKLEQNNLVIDIQR